MYAIKFDFNILNIDVPYKSSLKFQMTNSITYGVIELIPIVQKNRNPIIIKLIPEKYKYYILLNVNDTGCK